MKDCQKSGRIRTSFWAEATYGGSARFISPVLAYTARIQEEITNKLGCSAEGTHRSQPSLHIFPIHAILGEKPGQPFILGGYIPTYKGLAQLHNTLAL